MVWAFLVAALAAYLLGNLNGSVCVSAVVAHDDVRKHGSGNAGLTNFFRSYGGWSTLLVILVDMVKTVAAGYTAGWALASFGYYREGLVLGVVLALAQQIFGFVGIDTQTLLINTYPVRLSLVDVVLTAVAYIFISYVVINLTVRAVMDKNNA